MAISKILRKAFKEYFKVSEDSLDNNYSKYSHFYKNKYKKNETKNEKPQTNKKP